MLDRRNFIFKPGLKDAGKPLIDFRTIPLRAILRLKELPPLPVEWDAHDAVGGFVDDRMFNNSKYGDCLIAAQAHQTLTFEKFEQGIVIPITDKEVVDEYFRQTGGKDTGLYLTYAMKEWKNKGWTAAGKHHDIYAFAGVDKGDLTQVKYAIYLLNGVIFGMQLFETDLDQFRAGEPWHLTGNNGAFKGGHGVYGFKYSDGDSVSFVDRSVEFPVHQNTGYAGLPGVTKLLTWSEEGLTCLTWGEEQFMDWEFWNARVTQAFAIVDNRNEWMSANSPVNVILADRYLREITGASPNRPGCIFPCLGKLIRKLR